MKENRDEYISIIEQFLEYNQKAIKNLYNWLIEDEIHRLYFDVYENYGFLNVREIIYERDVESVLDKINDYTEHLIEVYGRSFKNIRSSENAKALSYYLIKHPEYFSLEKTHSYSKQDMPEKTRAEITE